MQSYRLDLTALCDWLDKQNLSLETLEPLDLQQFLGGRLEQGYKATSTARMLSAMRNYSNIYIVKSIVRMIPSACTVAHLNCQSRLPKIF